MLVGITTWNKRLPTMDAYNYYYQIHMFEEDIVYTTFVAQWGYIIGFSFMGISTNGNRLLVFHLLPIGSLLRSVGYTVLGHENFMFDFSSRMIREIWSIYIFMFQFWNREAETLESLLWSF